MGSFLRPAESRPCDGVEHDAQRTVRNGRFHRIEGDKLRASRPHSPEPEYLKDDRTPQWAREDLANLWHLPDILTPLQNSNYISVSVNADRLPHVVRKDRTERAAVGIAMGDLIRMTVAPALLDCGARRNTIHWCSPTTCGI